jgi:hypothetical protein
VQNQPQSASSRATLGDYWHNRSLGGGVQLPLMEALRIQQKQFQDLNFNRIPQVNKWIETANILVEKLIEKTAPTGSAEILSAAAMVVLTAQ